MSRIIELDIGQEWIKGDRVFAGATSSHDDVVLRMRFGEMWDGLAKTAEFMDANHENVVLRMLTTDLLVPDTTNTYDVPIPAEAKKFAGKMVVTIKGSTTSSGLETMAVTTVYGEFEIKESLWSETAAIIADITPTLAAQLQQEVESIKATIVAATTAADTATAAATAAAGSASSASTAADIAEYYGLIAQAIRDLTVSSETKDPSENASVTKTLVDGTYNFHFGIPRGTPGVSIHAGSYYGFYVDTNGHLHLVYDTDATSPSFQINSSGHLIMTIED